MLVLFILLMGIMGIAFRHDTFQSLLLLLRSASDDQRGHADGRRAADARGQVIVKHLPAIQDFGAIEILCTDKTARSRVA